MLPDSSKTKSAIDQDPEYAASRLSEITDADIEEILDRRANGESHRDSLTHEGHTATIEKLNQVIDSINQLSVTVRAFAGAKGDALKIKPVQRPESEFHRLLNDRIYEYEQKQKDTLLGDLGF